MRGLRNTEEPDLGGVRHGAEQQRREAAAQREHDGRRTRLGDDLTAAKLVISGASAMLALDDGELLVEIGITERGAQEEAVELGFGQRERPLLLDRVLGREQEERRRQDVCDAVDGHLPFCHRFEQGLLFERRDIQVKAQEVD